MEVECTGCPPLVCKPGEYKNPGPDVCDDFCQGGICSFSQSMPVRLIVTCDMC